MTPTPQGWAGRATEQIMSAWLGRLERMIPREPKPSTTVYNACYSAVYDFLVEHAQEKL